jgi:hypothetical protein
MLPCGTSRRSKPHECVTPRGSGGAILAHDRPRTRIRVDREWSSDSEVRLREEKLPRPAVVARSHADVCLLAHADTAMEEDPYRLAAAFDLSRHHAVPGRAVNSVTAPVDNSLAYDMDGADRSCEHGRIMRVPVARFQLNRVDLWLALRSERAALRKGPAHQKVPLRRDALAQNCRPAAPSPAKECLEPIRGAADRSSATGLVEPELTVLCAPPGLSDIPAGKRRV